MLHNPNLILMGSHKSTDLLANEEQGFVGAGLVSHRKSDGSVSILSADGEAIGVSLGETLDGDTTKCTVAKSGNFIPVQVTAEGVAVADLTFVPKVFGASIEFVDGGTAGSEVVTVTDSKISVSMDDGVSTAAQLKAAIDASAPAMLLINAVVVAGGQSAVAQAAFAETAIPVASYAVPGAQFKFSATTGMATSGGTVTGASFVSNVKQGIMLDKSTVFAAYVDMGGGL